MDIYIYSRDFVPVEILEGYSSVIWTKRWQDLDDAEITMPTSQLKEISDFSSMIDLYLYNADLDDYMIIDGYEVKYDTEQGEMLTIYGTDLLSILNRRIVWNQTIVSGTLTHCVTRLLNENVISPTNTNRKIDNFAIGTFTDTHTIDSAQFTGDTIYEAIQDLCNNQDVGYEIKLESGVFTFYLIEPTNRQNYVVFSRDFDNLISYDRIKSNKQIKNVALVAGEGEGTDRKTAIVNDVAGLDRRELFVDAREVSTNDGEVSLADYEKQLQAKGIEKLQSLSIDNSIDADIDTRMYTYPVDYEVGDYIKIVDYRGISHTAQITEYITNSDINGLTEYPNFIIKED